MALLLACTDANKSNFSLQNAIIVNNGNHTSGNMVAWSEADTVHDRNIMAWPQENLVHDVDEVAAFMNKIPFSLPCNKTEMDRMASCLGCTEELGIKSSWDENENVIATFICDMNVYDDVLSCPHCMNCIEDYNFVELSDMSGMSFTILRIILACFALGANALSLLAIYQFQKLFPHKYKPFHVYLCNLSCCDAFVSITCLAQDIHLLHECIIHLNCQEASCIGRLLDYLINVLMLCTVFANVLIVMNQYMGVEFPLRYRQIVTKKFVRVSIGIAWVVGLPPWIAISLISLFGNTTDVSHVGLPKTWCTSLVMAKPYSGNKITDIDSIAYIYLAVGILMLLFVIIIMAAYLRIRHIVLNSSKNSQIGNSVSKKRKMLKLNITVLVLGGQMVVFWSPGVFANVFPFLATLKNSTNFDIFVDSRSLTVFFTVLSCLLDPIIYALRLKEIRDRYRALFKLRS